jgi:hypothetical protein
MYLLTLLVSFGLLGPSPASCVVGGAAASARPAAKEEVKKAPMPSFTNDVQPLIAKYCYGCHGNGKSSGSVVLDKYKDEASVQRNLKVWEKAADNLRNGVMPPDGKPRPNLDQLDLLNTYFDTAVFKVDCTTGKKDPGRVTIHRLNRAEYNNTIRDLVGVDFKPANDFPVDDAGYGFDNIGDVLSMPPILMEKYLNAAEQVVEQAFQSPEIKKKLLNPSPNPKFDKEKGARVILRAFADRAYRRPATDAELKRLMRLVDSTQKNGESNEQAIELAMQAILVSPHFLFRIEIGQDNEKPTESYGLNDWELATRLSYFLWSTMPDDELYALCREGKLRRDDNLEKQVRRMLKDPKASALVDNFFDQWLQIRGLKTFTPDPKQFPSFTEPLRAAMQKETELFCQHIVAEDRSVLEFLDTNYTFVNETLAKHYGIDGVNGDNFRKVTFEDERRGGVLTQASILTITSNPTRTSPVKRGKWILENILGTPPPPPPANVPELKDGNDAALSGTLRQRMEQHRADPNCATCHQRMDPLGFGFENFDAIGAWRAKEGKSDIDASGVLPGDVKFNGPGELRVILKRRVGAFGRCLTEKMLTYALGRGMERTDKCTIDEIARNVAKDNYKFSSLVLEIVKSDAFQKRRGMKPD